MLSVCRFSMKVAYCASLWRMVVLCCLDASQRYLRMTSWPVRIRVDQESPCRGSKQRDNRKETKRYSSIGPTLPLVAFFSITLFEGGWTAALQSVYAIYEQTAYAGEARVVAWGRRDLSHIT